MKNKLYYIFGLFMCFVFTSGVYAEGIVITVESTNNTNVIKGEERDLTVKLAAEKIISNCQFKLENESNLDFVTDSIETNTNGWTWNGNITDGFTVTKPNGSDVTPNGGILKLKYKVNDTGKVTVKDIKCTIEEDNSEITHDNVEITFTTIDAADDMSLKSLAVTGSDKTIELKPDSFDYVTSIDSPNFGLEFETSNPDYQDKVVVKDESGNVIDDVKNISFTNLTGQGAMKLSIIINEKPTYTLLVTYIQKELDNSLEYIKINGDNITLKDGEVSYTVEIDNDVNSVEVAIALKDSENFKIGENSNINLETLKTTFNNFTEENLIIFVEPKDSSSGGVSVTYTIHIKKKGVSTVIPDKDEGDEIEKPSIEDEEIVNPSTGDISMFVMILILISSLIVSVVLYRKNLESYK